MPVKVNIFETGGTYFITFTCLGWLPLIEKANAWGAVYKWFDFIVNQGHHIIGYVIMPNHIHILIAFKQTNQGINTIVGNGKRFMAYDIVNGLKANGENRLLDILEQSASANEKLRNKKHKVWIPSFDWKDCRSNAFIEQKLNYMHLNPCSGKWNLAATPEDYEHSSAKFYICGMQSIYPVTNYLSLADIDFSE
ncbi:MAG: hypothetical protein IT243_02940 [Bacteroidia bacterium]|nr:hypothetical protein [Bacteroidia bacterium]